MKYFVSYNFAGDGKNGFGNGIYFMESMTGQEDIEELTEWIESGLRERNGYTSVSVVILNFIPLEK